MPTKACFVILITLAFALNDREQVRQLVPELCQYTNFCYTDAQEINITEKIPCCLPCSCDDDCWELDNCCPDKELMIGPRPRILPCIDSYVKPPSYYPAKYTGFYRVIDSCPSSEDSANFNTKCSAENRTSLEDFVWVSDKTGKIYQNTHCAECHGVKEKIPWQIETTCYDIMKANFGNFREMLLSDKCSINITQPEDLKTVTDKYTCFNPQELLYSSCNETGVMAHYDTEVETACKQSTWPYILGYFKLTLAKNVFCVMCNEDIPTSNLTGLCRDITDRGERLPLTFLIDYSSLSTGFGWLFWV